MSAPFSLSCCRTCHSFSLSLLSIGATPSLVSKHCTSTGRIVYGARTDTNNGASLRDSEFKTTYYWAQSRSPSPTYYSNDPMPNLSSNLESRRMKTVLLPVILLSAQCRVERRSLTRLLARLGTCATFIILRFEASSSAGVPYKIERVVEHRPSVTEAGSTFASQSRRNLSGVSSLAEQYTRLTSG